MVVPVFTMYLGVNPALLTSILFIVRIWDAFIDPVVGQFSDNFRSRWGRRKPMLALGAPLMCLLFATMWWFPAGASPNMIAFALLINYMLFAAAFTIYTMPLSGLTIEATNDYHERTRIAAFISVFGFAFQIGSQFFLRMANNTDWFPSMIVGVHWITGFCAFVLFCAAIAPIFLCRERNYALVKRQPSQPLIPSLKAALAIKPFRILLITRLVVSFSYNTVAQLSMMMCVYYVFNGDKTAGIAYFVWVGAAFHVVAIIGSTLLYPALSRRLGKRATMQVAAGALIFGCICKMFLYIPGQPWWQILIIGCNGLALSGLGLISASMMGDITDYDEQKNGTRREALFSSLVAWVDKAGNSVGSLVSGFLLVLWGYDVYARDYDPYILGAQSPYTLELMRWGYVLLPMLGAICAIVLMRRYSITEEQAYSTKEDLRLRHAKRQLDAPEDAPAPRSEPEMRQAQLRPRMLMKVGGALAVMTIGLVVAMDYCGVASFGIFKTMADLPPAERRIAADREAAKIEADLALKRIQIDGWLIRLYGHVPTPREAIPEHVDWRAPCAKLDAADTGSAGHALAADIARTIDESLTIDLRQEDELIIRLMKMRIMALEAEVELKSDSDAKARLDTARRDLAETTVTLKARADKRNADKKVHMDREKSMR